MHRCPVFLGQSIPTRWLSALDHQWALINVPLPIHSLLCVTLKSDDDLEVQCSAVEIVSHYLTVISSYSLFCLQKPEMEREILQEAPEKFIRKSYRETHSPCIQVSDMSEMNLTLRKGKRGGSLGLQ